MRTERNEFLIHANILTMMSRSLSQQTFVGLEDIMEKSKTLTGDICI